MQMYTGVLLVKCQGCGFRHLEAGQTLPSCRDGLRKKGWNIQPSSIPKDLCPNCSFEARLEMRSEAPRKTWGLSRKQKIMLAERIAMRDGGYVCHYCQLPLIKWGDEKLYCDWFTPPHGKSKSYWRPRENYSFIEFDHKSPRSLGGEHCVENLVMSCGLCNVMKRHSYDYEEFLSMAKRAKDMIGSQWPNRDLYIDTMRRLMGRPPRVHSAYPSPNVQG